MISFRLNGKAVKVEAHPLTRLIDVLREQLGDTSVKEGCGEGECGACSVFMNGVLINSCIVPVGKADNGDIKTMAGLERSDRGKVLIDAFAEEGAVQCGFCIPGMVMAGEALLAENNRPDEAQIREGISGNLCRCTGYDLIVKAINTAANKGKDLW
ncbi:MAG: (2Fe-2S)-binding protein [Spirochaetales bacterium]|jgi:aerobic carbon-monoxide dehydrogenase small subunit|nr:(2Fe-2S)-binding protein [Spirochaetales bacterium]